MLLQLAWKNIWRNKKRSTIIILAIAFGLWGGLFSDAVMLGMTESSIETAINTELAHIQIHAAGYRDEADIKNFIPNGNQVLAALRANPQLKSASGRMLVQGIASSPTSSFMVQITAIDSAQEKMVTSIREKIRSGSYFRNGKRNPALIGQKLAKRLKLKDNSKFVLSFQDQHGDITYISCRVSGIFKTASSQFDDSRVFVRQQDLTRILNLKQPLIHEIALRVNDSALLPQITASIASQLPTLEVLRWDEIAPEVAFLNDTMLVYSYLFVFIILLALLFGITNTMLMSVVDRVREFGVLIAVGMKKGRLFKLIILETLFLSLTGGILGIIFGASTIAGTAYTGIDLSFIATALASFGSESMLYPTLPIELYVILTIMIVVVSNIAAVFPALKATRLVPAKAIRSY